MPITCRYIDDASFVEILEELNLESMDDPKRQKLADQAVGDLEGDLSERYVVPLEPNGGGDFAFALPFVKSKIQNAMIEKIKQLIGRDKNRNVIVESGQRFIDLHEKAFKEHIRDLMDPRRKWPLKMTTFAEGSVEPVQHVGIARPTFCRGSDDC